MGLVYLGLTANSWQVMIESLWDQVLAFFLLVNTVAGSCYLVYRIYRFLIQRFTKLKRNKSVPRKVRRYLGRLLREHQRLLDKSLPAKPDTTEPRSFGVFLGAFASPPTTAQQRLLSQWDVLALDPFQSGVSAALASFPISSRHVLARLDTHVLARFPGTLSSNEIIMDLDNLINAINTQVGKAEMGVSVFTGVLLAEFAKQYQPGIVNAIARYIENLGLSVWLELDYPEYMAEEAARDIDMKLIQGVVYRNGTIRPDGDRQNYFQMAQMRAVMRTFAAQRVPHNPALVMWETVDDAAKLEYAVATRTYNWSIYNCALPWIGHAAALTDAEAAITSTLCAKPLGALMWLKEDENMKAHDIWRTNDEISPTTVEHEALFDCLTPFVPNLAERLQLLPSTANRTVSIASSNALLRPTTFPSEEHVRLSPLSVSAHGGDLTGLGCFQLGHEAIFSEFKDICQSQRNLKELALLEPLTEAEIAKSRIMIEALQMAPGLSTAASQAVNELLALLATAHGNENPRIQIFAGLHSGFQASSGTQYAGVYDSDFATGCLVLYLSNKSKDRAGTLLHTFLSSRQFTRTECFLVEQAMAAANNCLDRSWGLSTRFVHDIEQLSPTEAILLHRRLDLSAHGPSISAQMRECLEYQLLEVPSLSQQRILASTAYLGGEVSADGLVTARLSWLAEKGCHIPDRSRAIEVFKEIESRLYTILMTNKDDVYATIGVVMQKLLQRGQIDARVDILALSIFCAFRKHALDEVYLEVMDRNVYPNHATDQAGCFAENFALGSRCDSFFDTTPRGIGRVIASRYREYYMKHQPPFRQEGFTELPTAYAAMQVDFAPEETQEEMPFYYKITFFAIYAVPALIDVMLLTTIGRGLYLTAFMTKEEKDMATAALMIALLLNGAFGTWVCSGGTYYFHASAFPAMNLFILTRFVAGLAVSLLTAAGGFVVVLFTHSIWGALIFAFYLLILSTYQVAINALSIYQMPGSSFLSGRSTIITTIPILFISPILTLFIQHDVIVYASVLTFFLLVLLFRARNTIAAWSSWYLKIPVVSDGEVIAWYRNGAEAPPSLDLDNMKDNDVMPLARAALQTAVLRECGRWSSYGSAADELVKRLAAGYKPTMFLMRWYCKHKRSRVPLVYSTTWNLTLKAAMENITNLQKGLKLHSAFLHWRSTGQDVLAGILYFVVALLDKWLSLLTGGELVGLSAAGSEAFRLGVGFGLCYYLVGALTLDVVADPLWTVANEKTTQPINDLASLEGATANDRYVRRMRYWRSLCRYFFLHFWCIAIFAAIMWVFQDSRDNTVMFLSYIGAYTGLLWYQYNKIFCGPNGALSLTIGILAGLPVGLALQIRVPEFAYNGVISLGIATWVSCFASLVASDLGWPAFTRLSMAMQRLPTKDGASAVIDQYSVSSLEPCPELSQSTLRKIFDAAQNLPDSDRQVLDPFVHPGARVVQLLSQRNKSMSPRILDTAFPWGEELIQAASTSWTNGQIVVEMVSSRHLPPTEAKIRSLCRQIGESLHLFLIGPDPADEGPVNIHRQCRIAAESIVRATAEHRFGLSHDHAMLAELLVVDHNSDVELAVPEGARLQLTASSSSRDRVSRNIDKMLLHYLIFGIDPERDWEKLPRSIRTLFLKRASGSVADISAEDACWLRERLGAYGTYDVELHIARCTLGAALTRAVLKYLQSSRTDGYLGVSHTGGGGRDGYSESASLLNIKDTDRLLEPSQPMSTSALHKFNLCVKFLVLSLTGDPEYQRELNYVIKNKPSVFRWPMTFFLNGIWLYCRFLQRLLVPLALFHGRDHVAEIRRHIKGMSTVLEKNRIITESFNGPSTWFWTPAGEGRYRLSQYSGRHDQAPKDSKSLQAVNIYSKGLLLERREVYSHETITDSFEYDYEEAGRTKFPVQRRCIQGKLEGETVQYDHRGYITTGSAVRGLKLITWKFWYRKSAKHEDELLWAEYSFPDTTIKVLWSMPPSKPQRRLEEWIPFSTVTEATFIRGDQTYHASWDYEHKFHPEVAVTLNGENIDTPPMIKNDWFQVLTKPTNCSFLAENPLLPFSSLRTNLISRFLGFNVKRHPIPTSVARTELWKAWKDGREVDAISARWIDEKLLRSDQIMRPYWIRRDFGLLNAAEAYLDAQMDSIMARVDVDGHTSSWTHIAFKTSDFYRFGQGGDARINTRKVESQLWGAENELHVLAMDTSTWPNDPGGVSACRRDMINDLRTVRWHVVAESSNDYGVPRFQIERNVQSLTVLPLWGLDFLNPTHGVLETSLDSAVVRRSINTKTADIMQNFLPILSSLVQCARSIQLNRQHVEEATRALVDLNTYFETSRNWNDVWQHRVVKSKWRELWLTDQGPNSLNSSDWWDFEKPTIKQLDESLNLWCRYLFIFSLPVPERIPDVFQASHHFTGATYGIVCKIKRNCALHIWDHCISFREFSTFMSSAVSYDAPFVNSTLISLTHLSCVLLEHHADVVLPCCDYFNPGWEVELGSAEGVIEHRRIFERKIDPVVNGICNMHHFEPVKTVKTATPTVVMLSHIQYVKDIKNAIMATDIIVNKWGFRDYRLHVYGDQERAATIATECQELIASKNLQDHCVLKGLGKASVVLQDAWLFLNSSISEGLPLAMGEAALTGAPVVCTDVGASYCVVTDRESGNRFSEVVSPNDSESLARAQISVLALLGRWAAYAEDAPGTEVPVLAYPNPTAEQVSQISARMYAKTEQRRALGMLGRENVLKNFSSDRYLREHEQMLWIGKYRSPVHRARSAVASSRGSTRSSIGLASHDSFYMDRPRRASRLSPESWISLSSQDIPSGWRSTLSMTPSNISLRDLMKDKSGKTQSIRLVSL